MNVFPLIRGLLKFALFGEVISNGGYSVISLSLAWLQLRFILHF